MERFPSFVLEPHQRLFADTAVGELMSTSVIWFLETLTLPSPFFPPTRPEIEQGLSTQELAGRVGWHRKKVFSSKRGIEGGIAFIDCEEQAYIQLVIKTCWMAQQYENAYVLATQYQDPTERGTKQICVVGAKVLR